MTREEIEEKIFGFDLKAMKEDLHWVQLIDDGSSRDDLKDAIDEVLGLLIEIKGKEKVEVLEEKKEIETIDIRRVERSGTGYFIIPKHIDADKIYLGDHIAELAFVINEVIRELNKRG